MDKIKKLVLIIGSLSFLFLMLLNSQEKDVSEFNLELEYGKYVQSIVDNYIPNSFVSVTLTLQKDSTLIENSNINFDKNASLPGLPVGKTTTFIPVDKDLNTILPSKIISKFITIYIPETFPKDKITPLNNQLSQILKLSDNDLLKIEYYTPINGLKKSTNNILAYIFLGLLILFIINFRSGMKYIGKAIRRAAVLANQAGNSSIIFQKETSAQKGQNNLPVTSQGVIKVKLIKDKKKKEENLDFSFLTDLPFDKLMSLLEDEPIEDLPIILSVMPNDFCVYFCKNYKGPMDKLVKSFYTIKQRPKIDLKLIRVSLYQKYISMLEKDTITFSGEQRLCDIVQQLPYTYANQILNYIKQVNIHSFEKISKNLITIDKIKELNDIMIEDIVAQVEHKDFVKFLKIADEDIREKFYSTFSDEVINYLEKEISEIEPLDEKEKDRIMDVFINKLRELSEK